MRKLAIFLTLCMYMLSFSEVNQFLKIPFLVQHYKQHVSEQPGLSLMTFLKMHYEGIFKMDDDYQQDQRLPFRSTESPANSITVCSCNAVPFNLQPFETLIERDFSLYVNVSFHNSNVPDIFQPPRIA